MSRLLMANCAVGKTRNVVARRITTPVFLALLLMAALVTSAHKPGAAPPMQDTCGNGICGPNETEANCPHDCGPGGEVGCGNGRCDRLVSETCQNCPQDCTTDCGFYCGNDECDMGETGVNCLHDCGNRPYFCGDRLCETGETSGNCPGDCGDVCGNMYCGPDEDHTSCPGDCTSVDCGDGACDAEAHENHVNCGVDCGIPYCGDDICMFPSEDALFCQQDCDTTFGQACRNGRCDTWERGENADNCPYDCRFICGNGVCDSGEIGEWCESDCAANCGNGQCDFLEAYGDCPVDCYDVGQTGNYAFVPWWLYAFSFGGAFLAIISVSQYRKMIREEKEGAGKTVMLVLFLIGVALVALVTWKTMFVGG